MKLSIATIPEPAVLDVLIKVIKLGVFKSFQRLNLADDDFPSLYLSLPARNLLNVSHMQFARLRIFVDDVSVHALSQVD